MIVCKSALPIKPHLFSHSTRIALETCPSHPPQILLPLCWIWTTLLKTSVTFEWTQETWTCFRFTFMCRPSSKSHWIAYSLIWSDGYSLNMDTVFWRRACEDLIDIWFGCRYIFVQSPIGEITSFKCRLLLSAVPVHYLKEKKSTVEECRALRGIDTLCIPTISLYYNGSYLHDLEVQEEMHFINEFRRLFHHKWSWHEWQHLRGSNIVPFPLM